jgi:hypothetical protein
VIKHRIVLTNKNPTVAKEEDHNRGHANDPTGAWLLPSSPYKEHPRVNQR